MALIERGPNKPSVSADVKADMEEMVTGIRQLLQERLKAGMQSHEVQDLQRELRLALDDLSVELRKVRAVTGRKEE